MFDFDVRSGNPDRPGNGQAQTDMLPGLARTSASGDQFTRPISAIPRRPPVVVAPSSPLREAFKHMAERHAGAALVASHGVLLGTLNERDIVRRLLEPASGIGDLPVWRVMAAEPETLLQTDTVGYAVRKLWARGGRAMPILRSSGALCGLLEPQDLVAWLCGQVGAEPRADHHRE